MHSTFDRIGFSDTSSEQYSYFGVAYENPSEADKIIGRLKALDGVQSVRMGVMNDFVIVQDWLFGEIHKRLQGD